MSEYRGRIVAISDYMLKGWAIQPENLEEPVRIELQVDGEEPVEILADQFSAEFGSKLGSSGHHFFRVPVPMPHLLQGRAISARIAATEVHLTNSPFVVDHEISDRVDSSGLSYFEVVADDEGAGTPLVFKHKAIHNPRLSTLLFIAKPMSVASGAILAKLAKKWMRQDSVALSSKNLFVVQYTPSPSASIVELLSRIDPANRQVLQTFQNMIFIDPVDKLPFAVRAFHSSTRLFLVLTPGATLHAAPSEHVDVLVAPEGFETSGRLFPRMIQYDARLGSTFPASLAIKRAIREAQPRAINAFFQIYGARGRYDLPWTLCERYDAIVVAEPGKWHDPAIISFEQYVSKFATRVKAVYASEEFFLRYRTFIDQMRDHPERLRTLLLYALEDGSRIDVRN